MESVSEYISIDIEHNGCQNDPERDRILELAAVVVSNGMVIDRFFTRVHLLVEFNSKMACKKKLYVEDYLDDNLPDEEESLKQFLQFLDEYSGMPLLSHNIGLDLREISQRLKVYPLALHISRDPIDTESIYIKHAELIKGKDRTNLESAAKDLELPSFIAHCSAEDALTQARLYEKIVHGRELTMNRNPVD